MAFQKPRILSESESNYLRGKCLAGHATTEEVMALIGHLDLTELKFRTAIETLAGCMDKVFVFGAYGENWSNTKPSDDQDYEVINFGELLGNDQ